MIVVSVKLVSAIHPSRDTELARMEICNIGGTDTKGDYDVRTLLGRDTNALNRRTSNRTGKVTGYPRLAIHVWHLVAEALAAVQYDNRGKARRDTIAEKEPA